MWSPVVLVYILGHVCIASLVNRPFFRPNTVSILLIFSAAMLPDLDYIVGIQHHHYTHSLLFWIPAYVPFFVIFRQKALPYFIATISHFLIGDIVAGSPPIFLGITDAKFSIPLFPTYMSEGIAEIILFVVFLAIKPIRYFTIPLDLRNRRLQLCTFFAVSGGVIMGRFLNLQVPLGDFSIDYVTSLVVLGIGHALLLVFVMKSYFNQR